MKMGSVFPLIFLCVGLDLLLLHLLLHLKPVISSADVGFTFHGFSGGNLTLDGVADITSNGLLQLTNNTKKHKGHAFYPVPLRFRGSPAPVGNASSFSTTFVFAIISEYPTIGGHGIAFFISRSANLSEALTSQWLGLFNPRNNGNSTNHILAVELDTITSFEFGDIDDNHVGVDVNGLRSVASQPASYSTGDENGGRFQNLTLISGDPMQIWVDFDGQSAQLNVTLSPLGGARPARPLLSTTINNTDVISDVMYVGFSSSTGSILTSHYILGWSFQMNGKAQMLDPKRLPSLPRKKTAGRKSNTLSIWLPLAVSVVLIATAAIAALVRARRIKFAELLEGWELEYGPHRFSYRDLFKATGGFKDKQLLGTGGFGSVYKGVLPASKAAVAVKRVSHESRQGMREFVAEIISIGRLRHRNLVPFLGYCRRKGELLLVYEFMPNGSLDRYLYDGAEPRLSWGQRLRVARGVASGLLYLHEDWEKVVIHRDIKASNVLLDGELNGRLGDFGLSRLYDHGTDPHTTHVVGTMGYLAPELARTGKVSTATDVFAFGAFLLEVACGRRPIEPRSTGEEAVLVDWVCDKWRRGRILEARDGKMGDDYVPEEVELVLKLGLLCSHPLPGARPSMRQSQSKLAQWRRRLYKVGFSNYVRLWSFVFDLICLDQFKKLSIFS
ncbi:hypothetical protein Taro_004417 [Colocasia esculenta]|uniref:non-specific serine/threonine protein kinase n=1 Tax=Colocasia esculenta TaxID=4460 RepID=A0A843TRL2_COLES|nr:hypothetical protein [Colocasia esculenta]